MDSMPPAYRDREQTYIKHIVLDSYFEQWLYKMTYYREGHRVWFVDCFAGPWESQEPTLQDTSFAKALRTMNGVAKTLREEHGRVFRPSAAFIESAPESYVRLKEYVESNKADVDAHVFQGEFGDHVHELVRLMGGDPAFLFVDPTGWKGADMRFIAPLAGARRRDVLINVMYEHLHRFKDARHDFMRSQMRDFFGLTQEDLPESLSEEETVALYRQQLETLCGLQYVADLVVPLPTANRTKFRLVVGGHHPEVLKLFRDVEFKACGKVAAAIRSAAQDRRRNERRGASSLFESPSPPLDPGYESLHQVGLAAVRQGLPRVLERGSLSFLDLWARALRKYHVTVKEVSAIVNDLRKAGVVEVSGWQPRQRAVKDGQVVSLAN